MGKGSRNRIGRDDDIFVKNPKKAKKRRAHRPLPKWVVPVVAGVVAVAIVVAAILLVLLNNGTFKRTNILVKSQTSSKYSINQQTAQILIWRDIWDSTSALYQYGYYGTDSSEFEYCLDQAMTAKYNIHEYIEDYYAQEFTSFVAYCDEGVRAGIEFTKEEQDTAYENMLAALKSEAYDYYDFYMSQGLSSVSPYLVNYPEYPYFGQYLKATLGSDIKEKDIRRAAIIQAYADKVKAIKQNEFWETTAETVAAEVKANPENYYTAEYMMYSTEDAALAADLGEAKTTDAFKTAIVSHYVKNNYINPYNKYVTKKVEEVNKTLEAVSGKTTTETLDAALEAQGMDAIEYQNTDELPADIKAWLFPTEEGAETPAQFAATTRTTSDGLKAYVVVVSEVNAETGTVTAAYKEIAYDTMTDEELAKLTNTVLKSLNLPIAEDAAVYESASEKADAIVKALNAESANKAQILEENGTVTTVDITSESDANTILPEIRDAVFAGGVESGSVLRVGGQTTIYVVSVTSFTPAVEANEEAGTPAVAASANISYITVGQMDDVVGDLTSQLESEIPSESPASFQKSAEAGSYEEWLFGNVDLETMTGGAAVGTTFTKEPTATEKKYTVYLATKEIYKDTETVVRGAYVSFSSVSEAEEALKNLSGLKGYELLKALEKLDSNATTSNLYAGTFENNIIQASSVEEELKAWLFSEEREENDIAVVTIASDDEEEASTVYLAVFVQSMQAWESTARTNYASDAIEDWIDSVIAEKGYAISEKALKRVKNPKMPKSDSSETDAESEESEEIEDIGDIGDIEGISVVE